MRDTSLNLSLSESYLGPEVHLLSGIVLHSRLQHPLRFHPLDILHVPLTHESCSCGRKEVRNEARFFYLSDKVKSL